MPFTLAHPAAVLPFLRQPFVPIALVAGAMAPDLPYFAMVSSTSTAWYAPFFNGTNSHDFAQILSVGLPLALALCAVLWLIVKPLRWALPKSWVPDKPALKGRPPTSARVALWTFYSVMLGLLTHLLWDSFTHSYGWMVEQLPILAVEPVAGFPVYRLLQHGSTLAGAVLIVLWYLKRQRLSHLTARPAEPRGQLARTVVLGFVVAVPTVFAAVLGLDSKSGMEDSAGAESFLWIIITRGGAAAILVLLGFALLWHAAHLFRRLRGMASTNS